MKQTDSRIRCSKCGVAYDDYEANFNVDSNSRTGRCYYCRKCMNSYGKTKEQIIKALPSISQAAANKNGNAAVSLAMKLNWKEKDWNWKLLNLKNQI